MLLYHHCFHRCTRAQHASLPLLRLLPFPSNPADGYIKAFHRHLHVLAPTSLGSILREAKSQNGKGPIQSQAVLGTPSIHAVLSPWAFPPSPLHSTAPCLHSHAALLIASCSGRTDLPRMLSLVLIHLRQGSPSSPQQAARGCGLKEKTCPLPTHLFMCVMSGGILTPILSPIFKGYLATEDQSNPLMNQPQNNLDTDRRTCSGQRDSSWGSLLCMA